MKRNLFTTLLATCIFIMYSSCYKTGETIYQPTCKPNSIVISRAMYNFPNFFDFDLVQEFNGNLVYDANSRLIQATHFISGSPANIFEFIYDANNNLIRINDYDTVQGNPLLLASYYTFSYPSGTVSSISSTAQVQLSIVDYVNHIIAHVNWTYNFNAQFQLESIFQGQVKVEQLTYDFGGNCQTDSVYSEGGQLLSYYVYSSYDNGINPARSDRSLQLFFQMYNKNNPTNSVHYSGAAGADPNSFVIDKSTSGSYLYNLYNYPTVYAGNFFAQYNCQVAPPPPPIILPATPKG